MPAVIRVLDTEASLRDGVWKCSNYSLRALLNSMLSPYGATPSQPGFDEEEAKRAASALGGEVVSEGEAPLRKPGYQY